MLNLSKDIKFLKQGIRDFIDNEVEPQAMVIEETDEIPAKNYGKIEGNGLIWS